MSFLPQHAIGLLPDIVSGGMFRADRKNEIVHQVLMLANQLMILVVKLLGCVHDVFTDGSRGPKSDLRIRADAEPLGKFIVCDKYKLCWRENRPLFYFLPTKRKRTAHETAFIYILSLIHI